MSPSPQLELVQRWGEGFQKKDTGLLRAPLHEDFVYITHPKSLNSPRLDKEQWLKQMEGIMGGWKEMDRTILYVIEAPGKVITHYSGIVTTIFDIKIEREAITIATVDHDKQGELKITQVDEFIDSLGHVEAMKKLGLSQQT